MVIASVKEELKFAAMEHGQLLGLAAGTTTIPELCADSWDMEINVRIHVWFQVISNTNFFTLILLLCIHLSSFIIIYHTLIHYTIP